MKLPLFIIQIPSNLIFIIYVKINSYSKHRST